MIGDPKHNNGRTSGPGTIAATRMPSGGRASAACVRINMSEMDEDYPSDTGDDRFSAGGE